MDRQKTKGVILMLLSAGCYSATVCLLKLIGHIDAVFSAFMRFVFGLVLLGVIIGIRRRMPRFSNIRLLLARGILGGIAIYTAYLVIIHLGVSKGTMIIFTYPVFGTLFGGLLLKETLRVSNFIALGLAMTGLFLLVMSGHEGQDFVLIGRYELIGIGTAMLSGLIVAIIRKLHQTDGAFEIFFFHCLLGAAVLMLPAMHVPFEFTGRDWIILAVIGIFATAGQLCMTQGYRYLPVQKASLLSMSELILDCTVGIAVFHEAVTVQFGIGAVLIVSACVIVLSLREKSLIPERPCEIIDPVCTEQSTDLNPL